MTQDIYEEIGTILTMGARSAEELLEKVHSNDHPVEVRTAALDRYAKLKGPEAAPELEKIHRDYGQPEELRVHSFHWLRTRGAKTEAQTRPIRGSVVRTRGAAVLTRGGARRGRDAIAERPGEPSERLRWLEKLED